MIGSRSGQGNQDESGIFSGTIKLESAQKKRNYNEVMSEGYG